MPDHACRCVQSVDENFWKSVVIVVVVVVVVVVESIYSRQVNRLVVYFKTTFKRHSNIILQKDSRARANAIIFERYECDET